MGIACRFTDFRICELCILHLVVTKEEKKKAVSIYEYSAVFYLNFGSKMHQNFECKLKKKKKAYNNENVFDLLRYGLF